MFMYFGAPKLLIAGLIIGFVFGFLLQKGAVAQADTIFKQFLFKDFTMLKILLSALTVGSILLYATFGMGFVHSLLLPSIPKLAVLFGGLFLGAGLAISGYCPGTSFAAAGQGSRDAWFSILGLFVGAGIYASNHAWISNTFLSQSAPDNGTLATLLNVSPWVVIAVLAAISLVIFRMLEKRNI